VDKLPLSCKKKRRKIMETKIQMTPVYSLLIVTNYEESKIFIVSKRNGKEVRFFYSERLFQNVQDWDNREFEAHFDAVSYSYKVILGERNLADKLFSGKYIPGDEHAGYDVICA
jgi:uncharacterized protein Veg